MAPRSTTHLSRLGGIKGEQTGENGRRPGARDGSLASAAGALYGWLTKRRKPADDYLRRPQGRLREKVRPRRGTALQGDGAAQQAVRPVGGGAARQDGP